MAINWPLRWVASHVTAKRLIDAGEIGELIEVHFYDGNRGPLYHLADKVEVTPEEVERQKPTSWWYRRAAGGGSLLDYLGYGATLGTWYMDGEAPLEVTCTVDETPGIEVDQHAIAVLSLRARALQDGDPLGHLHRPLDPAAAAEVRLRLRRQRRHDRELRLRGSRDRPDPRPPRGDAGHGRAAARRASATASNTCSGASRAGRPVEGPLDPALCLTAQRIVDTAAQSAREKRTLELLP